MKTPAIGIDLGSSFCRVAAWKEGKVEIIANDHGNRNTPSYVAFTDSERLIGEAAKNQARRNPKNTVFNAKRLIGRSFDDPEIQADAEHQPFTVVNFDSRPRIQGEYKGETKEFTVEEIFSMFLTKMQETAEANLGFEVQDAVISVPAQFTYIQRQAIRDAGKIAGLNVLRIVNEPSAAALASGFTKNLANGDVLIFDLGGGTFDVSVITIEDSICEVLATVGDTRLGGEDFDKLLVNHLIDEFKVKYNKDISTSQKALLRLKTAAEEAKHCLSFSLEASIEIDALFEGIDFCTKVSRITFETLCSDLFNRTMTYVEKALADAKRHKSLIHDVVLVGGSTRIPKVKSLLQNFFGKPINFLMNPEEAVVSGAAILAAMLNDDKSPKIEGLLLLDVTAHSLGVETTDGAMAVVLRKNTTIPTKQTQTFGPIKTVQVYEGEHKEVKDNILLGRCNLAGFPQGDEIDVTFDVDGNGILIVTVKNPLEKSIVIKSSLNMSDYELKAMIDKAKRFNKDAKEQLARAEARNNLESFVFRMEEVMKVAGPKLTEVRQWLDSSALADHTVYKQKLQEIHDACFPITRACHEAGSSLGVDIGLSGQSNGHSEDSGAGCSSATNGQDGGPTIKEEPAEETPRNTRRRAFEEREPPMPKRSRFRKPNSN